MKKHLFRRLAFSFTFISSLVTFPALAVADKPADLPQTPGTYKVQGRSDLKLRVHVYNAKNSAKPGPVPTPSLVCNLTDPDSSTVDGVTGWYLPSGNWTYRLNTSSAPALVGGADMATLTDNAFDAWQATDVGSKVNFVRGANTSTNRSSFDGQNVITWGRTSGTALATTYTWYYTATHAVAEVDTVFNNRFAWEWSNSITCAYQNYYDAQNIMAHELGHWMGIDDNYDGTFTNNTMYGYGSPTEVKKNTLSTGDVNAVNAIY